MESVRRHRYIKPKNIELDPIDRLEPTPNEALDPNHIHIVVLVPMADRTLLPTASLVPVPAREMASISNTRLESLVESASLRASSEGVYVRLSRSGWSVRVRRCGSSIVPEST